MAVPGEAVTQRLHLGAAAVLSVTQAASLLPWRDKEARAWLHDRGLVRAVPGRRPVVIWSEVLDELRATEDEKAQPRRVAVALPRAGLRR
jgi:hypothetical protein